MEVALTEGCGDAEAEGGYGRPFFPVSSQPTAPESLNLITVAIMG